MIDVFTAILRELEAGRAVVRATVMHSSGSTPREAGACMAVRSDGTSVGTIGGGSVENASIQAAAKVLQNARSEIREFDLTNADAARQGMVCGGNMAVLLDCILPDDGAAKLLRNVLELYDHGQKCVLITHLSAENEVVRRELWQPGDEPLAGLPALCLPERLVAAFSTPHQGGILFAEPLAQAHVVHFIGAGHVAQAAAHLASFTGFRVRVVDDRAEFANHERFPEAQQVDVVDDLAACLPEQLGPQDSVVIMTRGHMHDRDVLAQALTTGAGYIGMIGSKKKRAAVYESLRKEGVSQAALDSVHCPIGLSIGANTPQEIAVSILAELIEHRASA